MRKPRRHSNKSTRALSANELSATTGGVIIIAAVALTKPVETDGLIASLIA